ncbi:glycosyltransferase family 2 protein [Candidatus Daviesbacteria bacterium]|nr:glycosyltransferase family 2 protein [Candidatus Daviesbacteria bacterium]
MAKMNFPLVSVLILTYNRADLLKTALSSALKSDYPNLEFIVVDNESSEDISGFVKKTFPKDKVKVVRLKKNKGLTGGFNFGFKYCQGKYTMLLCNDTKIDKKAVTLMVKIMEKDSQLGMVVPKVIQMRKPTELHSAGGFVTIYGMLYHYGVYQNKHDKKYQKIYYVFTGTGAGYLIKTFVGKTVGLYDDDFYIAYDDIDLCHKIWLSGYKIVYCPKAELLHYWSATLNASAPKLWYWAHRNGISSYIQNLSLPYLFIILPMLFLCYGVLFAERIIKRKFGVALSIPSAYIWHIFNIRKTLKKRNIIQREIRKVSDGEIFKYTMVNPGWRYYLISWNRRFDDVELPERVLYFDK